MLDPDETSEEAEGAFEVLPDSEQGLEWEDFTIERATLKHALEKSLSCLQSAEVLLVDPTPQAIEITTNLLEDAMAHFDSSREVAIAADASDLMRLKFACDRVRALLDGALRAQWHHMRHMGSFQEHYNPADKREQWKPRISSFTLEG